MSETAAGAGASSAERAGLVYASDLDPGIARRRSGRGFRYLSPSGSPIRSQRTLDRLRALVIPPAWTDVWISPDPAIRARIERDLALRGLPRAKVLAAVLFLIDSTLIRVGNERYRRLNDSFGATTLRNRHAAVRGGAVRVSFRGKHGRRLSVRVVDARFARIVRGCQELRGQDLFSYRDGDEICDVRSDDVNDYLREISGDDFSVKDFHTWGASALALALLADAGAARSERDAERTLTLVTRIVARDLGNTSQICRRSYVHPAVIDAYRAGAIPHAPLPASRRRRLDAEEAALARLLADAAG